MIYDERADSDPGLSGVQEFVGNCIQRTSGARGDLGEAPVDARCGADEEFA